MVERHLSVVPALKEVQREHPFYNEGAEEWWRDVISRTAIEAGGNKDGMYYWSDVEVSQLDISIR